MGDDNELSFLVFNEGGHVVKAELDHIEHFLLLGFLILDLVSGFTFEALLLLSFGLGTVLVEQLEDLASFITIESVLELVDSWGDFQALQENSLLALDPHILRPRDETRKILSGLDVAADAEVLWPGLHKRV